MPRVLTCLATFGLILVGLRGSPPAPLVPVAHNGFALTQLVVQIASDGSVGIRGGPVRSCEPEALGEAMRTARQALRPEVLAALVEAAPKYQKDLFAGWLRVHVDPKTRFGDVWPLFMGPARDHAVFRFAFDPTGATGAPEDASPIFVEMPHDWGVQCFDDMEFDPAVWLILSAGSGEFQPVFGTMAQASESLAQDQEEPARQARRKGLRHALGNYQGGKVMTVGAYYTTASEALEACGGIRPHLVVEADVPWKEVEPVLRALAKDGVSWWPVLAEEISMVIQR